MNDYKDLIHSVLEKRLSALGILKSADNFETLICFADDLIDCHKKGNASYWFGNGGSGDQSIHMATELAVKYKKERDALAAYSLSANAPMMLAIGNDFGFDHVFERQIEAYCADEDVAVGISTSGNSKNIFLALKKAHQLGTLSVYLGSENMGDYHHQLIDYSRYFISVSGGDTSTIQENHLKVLHTLAEIVEEVLFADKTKE